MDFLTAIELPQRLINGIPEDYYRYCFLNKIPEILLLIITKSKIIKSKSQYKLFYINLQKNEINKSFEIPSKIGQEICASHCFEISSNDVFIIYDSNGIIK